ncbi:hypothetical protein [Vibrio parahaemolyticus]|uniref:AbiU2 domain-containing protein n=1 Tax=Vibrio parahaemolyticus TaxID=670 RepID=UPI0023621C76|nr:hypothetical protein [Vibrio parahaemolyticus]
MDVFKRIKDEVNEIHFRWVVYRQVYAQGPKEIELLNKNGAYFFSIAQHLFMDNVALSFSKLTDPNKQGSNENLSLKQLIVLSNNSGDLELAHALKEKFEELLKSCDKFRKLRNKRIAHADLGHAMGVADEPLPGISRQYVEDALALLRDFMNTYELAVSDSQTLYDEIILDLGSGGDVLLNSLRKATHT